MGAVLALVRWTRSRVYLEAVQIGQREGSEEFPYYVARFVAPLGSRRLDFRMGSESRQNARCRFVSL